MSHLEPRQYRTIFRMSFLSIGSAVYAMYRQYYMLVLCPAGVLFTSINYWRKPEPWSRTLDMTYVLFALTYQLYKAYHAQYRIPYYMITFVSGSMYPLALYYSSQKQYWHSTYSHCGIHVLANVANLVLYSGNIL